jgi:hypothetical protein
MIQALERQQLEAELGTLQELLEELPASCVLERRGFEARADGLRARLRELAESPRRAAEGALFFSGAPVVGAHAISIEFAGAALESFADVLDAQAKSATPSRRTNLTPSKRSGVFVTGTLPGSFGFRIEEIDPPLVGETDAASNLHEVIELLRRVSEARTAGTEGVLVFPSKALHEAVRRFFKTLKDGGAVVRIQGDGEELRLDRPQIGSATEVLDATQTDEEVVTLEGTFGGRLLFTGKFDFWATGAAKAISGRVDKDLKVDPTEDWSGRPCRAEIRVVRTTRGERAETQYTLLGLEPMPGARSEDDSSE